MGVFEQRISLPFFLLFLPMKEDTLPEQEQRCRSRVSSVQAALDDPRLSASLTDLGQIGRGRESSSSSSSSSACAARALFEKKAKRY